MRARLQLVALGLALVPVACAADSVAYACLFQGAPEDCGFRKQAKAANRITVLETGATRVVRLRTLPGDSDVYGSRAAERADLALSQHASDCYAGREHWWAHSVLFPDDYVAPPQSTAAAWHFGVVADFHNTAPGGGQANFQVTAMPATATAPDRPTGLGFEVAHGDQRRPTVHHAAIGPVVKNAWYHFVYRVRWSAAADGYVDAWVNGAKKMRYRGPTLYSGQGCYFKLANYHSAFGAPSSVIHARVVRGSTAGAVSTGSLEGILHLRQVSRSGR